MDYLGYLTLQRCKEMQERFQVSGRQTVLVHIALINLGDVDCARPSRSDAILAFIPIIVSVVTCIMCALVQDWYSFTTILVGISASGFAAMTIGASVKLIIKSVSMLTVEEQNAFMVRSPCANACSLCLPTRGATFIASIILTSNTGSGTNRTAIGRHGDIYSTYVNEIPTYLVHVPEERLVSRQWTEPDCPRPPGELPPHGRG